MIRIKTIYLQKYLLVGAISVLFLPSIVLADGSSIVGSTIKYAMFFSSCFFAVLVPGNTNRMKLYLFLPLVLFCFFGMASVLWSDNPRISIERSSFNTIIVVILFSIAVKVPPIAQLKCIRGVGIVACFLVLLGSVPAYLLGWEQSYFQGNYRGIFYNSNLLGHLIGMVAIPYAITSLFISKKHRYFNCILLAILTLILIESRSRASILAAIISVAYIIIAARHSLGNVARSIILFVVIMITGFVIKYPGFLLNKYGDVGIDSTLATRGYLWLAHYDAIYQKPLLGWGIGVNPVSFKTEVFDGQVDTEKGNSYITIPEEVGIPLATIVFLGFIYFIIKKKQEVVAKTIRENYYNLRLLPSAIVVSGLVHAFFESWLFYFGNPMSFLFWTSCVYMASPVSGRRVVKSL